MTIMKIELLTWQLGVLLKRTLFTQTLTHGNLKSLKLVKRSSSRRIATEKLGAICMNIWCCGLPPPVSRCFLHLRWWTRWRWCCSVQSRCSLEVQVKHIRRDTKHKRAMSVRDRKPHSKRREKKERKKEVKTVRSYKMELELLFQMGW